MTNWQSHKVSQTSRKNGCMLAADTVFLLEAEDIKR